MRNRLADSLIVAVAAIIAASGCNSADKAATADTSAADDTSGVASTTRPVADAQLRLGSPDAGDLLIGPTTTEADLIKAYGADNVTRESVPLAEGDSAMTTVLFAADSSRRLEIFWTDTATRSAPERVRLRGAQSAWSIGEVVTLGSTLPDVQGANGKPFKLLGFRWDYEGTVSSWEGGRLGVLPKGVSRVIVRFHPEAFDRVSDADAGRISGDNELLSTDPIVRQVDPRVYTIEVQFGEPGTG